MGHPPAPSSFFGDGLRFRRLSWSELVSCWKPALLALVWRCISLAHRPGIGRALAPPTPLARATASGPTRSPRPRQGSGAPSAEKSSPCVSWASERICAMSQITDRSFSRSLQWQTRTLQESSALQQCYALTILCDAASRLR
jgi:hypothetical protein